MAVTDNLVTKYEDVVLNMKQFNMDLQLQLEIIDKVSFFKHWYYIPEINSFGPSSYIGYKNMTTLSYNNGKGKSGVETEKALREWFILIQQDTEEDNLLRCQLTSILASFDKKLRSNAVFHLPKNVYFIRQRTK